MSKVKDINGKISDISTVRITKEALKHYTDWNGGQIENIEYSIKALSDLVECLIQNCSEEQKIVILTSVTDWKRV